MGADQLSQSGAAYDALKEAKGNVSVAASIMQINRAKMVEIIKANAVLTELVSDMRDAVVDKAEGNIFDDVEKGDQTASRLVATTLGKDRGWTTRQETSNKDPLEVHIRSFVEVPPDGQD